MYWNATFNTTIYLVTRKKHSPSLCQVQFLQQMRYLNRTTRGTRQEVFNVNDSAWPDMWHAVSNGIMTRVFPSSRDDVWLIVAFRI